MAVVLPDETIDDLWAKSVLPENGSGRVLRESDTSRRSSLRPWAVGLRIRPAQVGDAQAIARVHLLSRQSGHSGLFPVEVVDALSLEERELSP